MTQNTIKHLMIIIPGGLLLYTLLPIGDYCTGTHTGIAIAFLGLALVLVFLVITIGDILRLIRKKEKFDFIPLLLFIFFIGVSYWILNLDNKKFWTKENMKASYEDPHRPNSLELILYKDNSFAASSWSVDFACVKQGNYRISNDTLYLNHPDLTTGEKEFSATYLIDKEKKLLTDPTGKYRLLKIFKIN